MDRLRRLASSARAAKVRQRAGDAFSIAGLAASVVRQTAIRRFPDVTLAERLADLPAFADVAQPVTLRWSDTHIPFVEAASDRDGAVGLGVVHGHLRLAQMEVMRRAATGRLSEVAGPAALELDRFLRLMDFPRAREASLGMMPPHVRDWVDGFAAGISAAATTRPPPEFEIFGIAPEPWTVDDLFAVSRLCSADYSWRVWRTLFPLRAKPEWRTLWHNLVGEAAAADEEFAITPDNLSDALPTAFARTGSNACAVSGSRTVSGHPMLACDPHLVITTPNIWLVAGLKSPSVHVWGMMLPALPIFAPGRNAHGAWGGTNLHATSSELVDVSDEPITERRVSIPIRGRADAEIVVRESPLGPLISDAKPFAEPPGTVALHWMGHRPSDEFSAFYNMMRAPDWEGFCDAVDAYALPGLTMVWAGADGRIGRMIGAHLPNRPTALPDDIVASASDARAMWADIVTGRDLPHTVDPECGYVVSANEEPDGAPITISLFFSSSIRARRLAALIEASDKLTLDDLFASQLDVYLAPAHRLARGFAAEAKAAGLAGDVVDALAAWDGCYDEESAGALSFELIAAGLVERLEERAPDKSISPGWRPFARLIRLVGAANEEGAALREALAEAVEAAAAPFAEHRTWGALHRVRLQHPLARVPWLATRLTSLDFATAGSNETLFKSLHPIGSARHATPFGANARFVADLSDPDATYAIVLGGQDGWPGSRTLFDQVGAWRRGDMIQLPVTPDRFAEAFPHVHTLSSPGTEAAT